ncbi:MAG TPA: GNAT family N-acetyltransferase [Bacillota bacterium]|nr:GNAT family N-acetyltransferase [Bacillota bacterium]
MLDKTVPFGAVIMVKCDASSYPRFTLPDGYTLLHYTPGREREWAKIMASVGEAESEEAGLELFYRTFSDHPELLGSRNLFVADTSGRAVATASLWEGGLFGVPLPRVHWVACMPGHQGKGLVKALLSSMLDMHNKLALGKVIYLTTQTWSYRAIGLYKKFGFEPYLGPKPASWTVHCKKALSEELDLAYTEENRRAWAIIDGKIAEYEAKREN